MAHPAAIYKLEQRSKTPQAFNEAAYYHTSAGMLLSRCSGKPSR